MPDVWRLQFVCEDRLTERFVRKLCERCGVTLLRDGVWIAPSGKGAASAWVIQQYARVVAQRRSKNFQARLAVLFVVDGDAYGVEARLRALEQQLADRRVEPRRHDEPIAVFVPTWSIETWIAHLCEKPGVMESTPLKLDAALRHLWEKDSKSSIEHSVANWAKRQPPLPSLEHAYREAARVGLKGAS